MLLYFRFYKKREANRIRNKSVFLRKNCTNAT